MQGLHGPFDLENGPCKAYMVLFDLEDEPCKAYTVYFDHENGPCEAYMDLFENENELCEAYMVYNKPPLSPWEAKHVRENGGESAV